MTRTVTVPPASLPGNSPAAAQPPGQELGVYVHFPYCLRKCPYCDFVSFAADRGDIPHARYADAIIAELGAKAERSAGRGVATVFFGGGTPSLWEPAQLGRVLGALDRALPIRAGAEITMESNPSSLDAARARAFVAAGVNRISVGVQSLEPARLAFLGRLHDAEQGLSAVRAALTSGAERVSADLIFAVEGGAPQSPADAALEVSRVADLGVTHLSAYGLTIEPNTAFGDLARKKRLPVATDDVAAESFAAVERALCERGFAHYEISNYAHPGHEARHNLGYWRGRDYLGLGTGAVGTLREDAARPGSHAVRERNVRDPDKYMRRALAGESVAIETERLDPEARLTERIMLGLRLEEGVDLGAAARELGIEVLTAERERSIVKLVDQKLLWREGERVGVTTRGRLVTDRIVLELA